MQRVVGVFLVALGALSASPSHAADTVERAFREAVQQELGAKQIPSVAFALIDGDKPVMAGAVGFADAAHKLPANQDTLYKVGSVTKLFTDLAAMQLVEQGKLDLDAPVQQYLPEFHPENPYGTKITLRHLMTHQSGLVREPPLGSYFDPHAPDLASVVESLNRTRLVAEPGTVTKYSNAAITVIGRVLERVTGKPYAQLIQDALLQPAGMVRSGIDAKPKQGALAYAEMAFYDSERFLAPDFRLGTGPAGSLIASAADLARFAGIMLHDGATATGRLLRPETLASMWKPQVSKEGSEKFGLGFSVDQLDGHRVLGHGGAVYGYVTDFRFLPDEKLAVVVLSTLDAGPSAKRLGDHALRLMLAARAGKPLPQFQTSAPVGRETARKLQGWYSDGADTVQLRAMHGTLYLEAPRRAAELRQQNGKYVLDDALTFSDAVEVDPAAGWVRLDGKTYQRAEWAKPPASSDEFAKLIGEYGWAHNYVRVYERDGRPYVRIEWLSYEPMRRLDADTYAFPDQVSLYRLETLHFQRDANGNGSAVELNGIVFPRRDAGAEFDVQLAHLLKARDDLRSKALAAKPPVETERKPKPDLIALASLDPSLRFDIRYATKNNLLGQPLYEKPIAFLQRPTAQRLVAVNQGLHAKGYGLLIHDAYRPWFVTRMFWDAMPAEGKIFVANPSQGSMHNRGCAVDLTLYTVGDGKPVEMPGRYDEISSRSYSNYVGGTDLQRWHRELLRGAMEADGFDVIEAEWWHFDCQEWRNYPILNRTFTSLEQAK